VMASPTDTQDQRVPYRHPKTAAGKVFYFNSKTQDSLNMVDVSTRQTKVLVSGDSIAPMYDTDGSHVAYFQYVVPTLAALALSPNATTDMTAYYDPKKDVVNLHWSADSNATGVTLERSEGDTQHFTTLSNFPTNMISYTDTSVSAGNIYYYRVVASNPSGTSTSQLMTVSTMAAPSAPINLTAVAATSKRINLSWTDTATNEAGYIVYRTSYGAETLLAKLPPKTIAYSDTTFNPYSVSYRVAAYSMDGDYSNESSSNILAVTNALSAPAPNVPAAPSNLLAQALSNSQISLSWNDNSQNESGFIVEASLDGKAYFRLIVLPPNTSSYDSQGLNAATQYWYRVRATNADGDSANTNVATATTEAAGSGTQAKVPITTWTNPANSLDVNGDGQVTNDDLQILQTELATNGARKLPTPPVNAYNYIDTNGDGYFSSADVLAVINYLNSH